MPKVKALLAWSERWKPYRSAGAWYLWRAVELHQQGRLPKRAGRAPRIEIDLPKAAPARKAKRKGRAARKKTPVRRAVSKGRPAPRR
jgi:hypothetical protein